MTTEQHIVKSLEKMFLSDQNIRDMTAFIGRDVTDEMRKWVNGRNLDDYESVQMDYSEALDFVNIQFSKEHKNEGYELDMSRGQNYPKYYIDEGVERYNAEDFRLHDAQYTQETMRSNANFRYNNKFKSWETGLYKRHYDREEHDKGLRDTRELDTLQRGYSMEKIWGPNDYESADSTMYDYDIEGY